MNKLYAVPDYVIQTYIPEGIRPHVVEINPADAYGYDANRPSVSELAKAQGLEHFDVALPIDWVREFVAKTGFNPVGHFVMDYSENTYGLTKPITREGIVAKDIFNHVSGMIKLEG